MGGLPEPIRVRHPSTDRTSVEFWDKFGSENGVVCQCGFLDTIRFGPDVVLCTL